MTNVFWIYSPSSVTSKYTFSSDEVILPQKDFIDYALEIKKVPHIYRVLASLSTDIDEATMLSNLQQIQGEISSEELYNLPLVKALRKEIKRNKSKDRL